MRDLSVRGVYRRHLVEPAIEFFGTNDPTIVGDPNSFSLRKQVLGGTGGWVRPVIEPLAFRLVGPQKWYQNVCDRIKGSTFIDRTWTHIDVRIMLVPDADVTPALLSTLRVRWKAGIEETWNSPVRTAGGSPSPWRCASGKEVPCRISVLVQWVTSNPHHVVKVHMSPAGGPPGRADQANWYDTDAGSVAAHEFGHMLGLPDEYADAALCPGRSPVGTGTVMDNNSNFIPARLVQWVPDAIGSSLL